ncbi:MAG: hypothetical protein V1929_11965 [bacterium]
MKTRCMQSSVITRIPSTCRNMLVAALALLGWAAPQTADALTLFPDEPAVVQIGNPTTLVTQISTQRVDGTYNVTNDYDGVQFYFQRPADFSALGSFQFDIRSDTSVMKLEFGDDYGQVASTFVNNLTPSYQTVTISSVSLLTANPNFQQAYVRNINFVLEGYLATNKIGNYSVVNGGGLPPPPVGPGANTQISTLPGNPLLNSFAHEDVTYDLSQVSSNDFHITYDVTTNGAFLGLSIQFGSAGTDLSGFTSLVFAAKGNPSGLKIEVNDTNKQARMFIKDIVTNAFGYYQLPMSYFQGRGLNLAKITTINLILERDLAGAGNLIGSFDILINGLQLIQPKPSIGPGGNTLISNLPGKPAADKFGFGNFNTARYNQFNSTNHFQLFYNVATGGFTGVSMNFDNGSTPARESGNFSGLTSLVFGVQGDAQRVEMEIEDTNSATPSFRVVLTGITASVQYYQVPISLLTGNGVDVSRVAFINFVVDQGLAGDGHSIGYVDVFVNGLKRKVTIGDAGPLPLSNLPGRPGVGAFANPPSAVSFQQFSTNQFRVGYNVAPVTNFVGAYIGFGDGADISSFTSLVIAIDGDSDLPNPDDKGPRDIKVEFNDANTNTSPESILFTNAAGPLKYFQIPTAYLAEMGIDLSHLQSITFIVENSLVGPSVIGTFDVFVNGLNYIPNIAPGANTQISNLPGSPNADKFGFANFDTAVFNQFNSTNHFQLQYNVTTGGMTGVGMYFPAPTDLTSLTSLVFGVQGNPERLSIEINDDDTNTATTVVRLSGITSNGISYYQIPMSVLSANPALMNRITFIGFIVDQGLAGAPANYAGQFDVYVNGLALNLVFTPGANTQISSLPGSPNADKFGFGNFDTAVFNQFNSTNHFQLQYNVSTGGFTGAGIYFPSPTDLTTLTSLVFGIQGNPQSIKLEINDNDTNTATTIVRLTGMTTNGISYFQMPMSLLTAGPALMDQLTFIGFIMDQGLAGPSVENQAGQFDVYVNGLALSLVFTPGANTQISTLPGSPNADKFGFANFDTAVFNQFNSTNHFQLQYNVSTGGMTGVGMNFAAPTDLTVFTSLVFGIQGNPQSIKLEFNDNDTNTATTIVRLTGMTTNGISYFQMPMSLLSAGPALIDQLTFIGFIMDQGLAGPSVENQAGAFDVYVNGLRLNLVFAPGANTQLSNLPGSPGADKFGFANFDTAVYSQFGSTNHFRLSYNVATGGMTGVGMSFPAPIDLTVFTSLVFGVQGNPQSVQLEFNDNDTNTATTIVRLTGMTTNGISYFQMPLSLLSLSPTLMSQITFIGFIMDQNQAGAPVNHIGAFDIYVNGLRIRPIPGAAADLMFLPGNATVSLMADGLSMPYQVFKPYESNFFGLVYNVATQGTFAGALINFDTGATPTQDTANLSGLTSVIFAVRGSTPSLKFEFNDANPTTPAVAFFYDNVTTNIAYYHLPVESLIGAGLDISNIAVIATIVDAGVAHPAVTGYFDVFVRGLSSAGLGAWLNLPTIGPTVSTLPNSPSLSALPNSVFGTIVNQLSTQRFQVTYQNLTNNALVVGAVVSFDNTQTPQTESADLTPLNNLVIKALRSTAPGDGPLRIKVAFVDTWGSQVEGYIMSLTGSDQLYSMNLSEVTRRGGDLTRVKELVFFTDRPAAGGQFTNGLFEINVRGLANQIFVFRGDDSDLDGLPDYVELALGMNPNDDGSGIPANGGTGDLDGDGVSNYREYIAGTALNNANDMPFLSIEASGNIARLSVNGIGQRRYEYERRTNAFSGTWQRVSPQVFLATDATVTYTDVTANADQRFYYRSKTTLNDVTRLPASPDTGTPAINIFGVDATITYTQLNSQIVRADYDVSGGGFAVLQFVYDDFGTAPPAYEYADFSTYAALTFGISGTLNNVNFEIDDVSGNRIAGTFVGVNNPAGLHYYTINFANLPPNAITIGTNFNFARVKSITFVVDQGAAGGASNYVGNLTVKAWGLSFAPQAQIGGSGPVTSIPQPGPTAVAFGGIGSVFSLNNTGGTNLLLNYDLTGDANAFVALQLWFDDGGTPQTEVGDFSAVSNIVFRIAGNHPAQFRAEFHDTTGTQINMTQPVQVAPQFYAYNREDLASAGLDLGRINWINFVIDRSLAGAGNFTGTFTVVTSGVRP